MKFRIGYIWIITTLLFLSQDLAAGVALLFATLTIFVQESEIEALVKKEKIIKEKGVKK